MKRLIPVALALSLGGAPLLAAADDAAPRALRISRVELARPDRVRDIYRQIRREAELACGVHDGGVLERRIAAAECRDAATARAIADIDAPLLTALHRRAAAPAMAAAE